jgi:hypothetical protein
LNGIGFGKSSSGMPSITNDEIKHPGDADKEMTVELPSGTTISPTGVTVPSPGVLLIM